MRIPIFALLLLVSAQARATWTLVQHPINSSCPTATTCAVTTTATGASHLIVAVRTIPSSSGAMTAMSSTGGTAMTWVHCPSCNALVTNNAIDAYYTLSSTSGNTTITATTSVTNGGEFEIFEYSTTSGPAIYDTSGLRSQSTSAAPTNVALTLTGTNDVIVQCVQWNASITGASAPFTSPGDFPASGNAYTGAINTTASTALPYAPTTANTGAFMGIAFKETTTAAVPHKISRPI